MATKPREKERKPASAPKSASPGTAMAPVAGKADGGALILMGDKQQLPDYIKQDQARGSEQVRTEDLVIPRLEIVQMQSPEVTQGKPEYNPAAKPGMLFNSVTGQMYGNEVFVVPVHYTKLWLVWKDRNKGGGFRGAFPTPAEAEDRVKQEGGANAGFQSVDTPTHLCLLIDAKQGKFDEIIISMPRTKAKISRQWNSMIRMAGGDRFSRAYRVTTGSETNDKGTFFNFAIAQSGFPAKIVYDMAEKLYESVASGSRNVVMDTKGYDPDASGNKDDSEM